MNRPKMSDHRIPLHLQTLRVEWETILEVWGNKCLCCGKVGGLIYLDHIAPISKGGTGIIENIQPLCQSCNAKKYTKDTDYRTEWHLSTLPQIKRTVEELTAERSKIWLSPTIAGIMLKLTREDVRRLMKYGKIPYNERTELIHHADVLSFAEAP